MRVYKSLFEPAESDNFHDFFGKSERIPVKRIAEKGVESAFVFIEKELSFDSEYKNEVSTSVGKELKRLLKSVGVTKKGLILTVGVGNQGMTVKSRGRGRLAGLAPGVGGVTGIDSFDVVKGVTDRLKPAAVIAVDTLSARNATRLKSVVQLSTDGLVPGSGVGNAKRALGVPVIALGVPLVIEALDIRTEGDPTPVSKEVRTTLEGLVVTVKEIDLAVEDFAEVIGHAINFAVHGT